MDCEQVRPALMDYLLEEVPAEARPGIQQHLEHCAACSEEVRKFRQTLALLSRARAVEEVPQRIRLVAEPANRWLAFWRNPARVAFAAAGLACVAIALLALFQANISIGDNGMQLAFGAAPQAPALTTVAAPSPIATVQENTVSREEIVQLVSEAVAASEARQQSDARRLIENVSQQAEEQRARDWRDMAESLRPLQAAQVTMWKQQVQSQQYVSELIQQAGLQLPVRP